MHLKRDADFALRVLYCLVNSRKTGESGQEKSLPLAKIAIQAGIPRMVARRICDRLREAQLIELCGDCDGLDPAYCVGPGLSRRSLSDVIRAMEGSNSLFAVFGRDTPVYRHCREEIDRIERAFERMMADVSLEKLLEEDEKDRRVLSDR